MPKKLKTLRELNEEQMPPESDYGYVVLGYLLAIGVCFGAMIYGVYSLFFG
ncbi:hypothetical protein [Microbulbifer sp. 2205BS26-8]|uniref:hypothetical protein n=1 Tax=Microbulbifer sp. 2205BS26-8 TaxID=3064386 RepID=UPI00273EA524|nr:hypothetical protein [Microbulbifer sp. 2205BS26-8]MDP5211246.1 hypothetical protein [Microbulbifer sp. 2205BS26-8]